MKRETLYNLHKDELCFFVFVVITDTGVVKATPTPPTSVRLGTGFAAKRSVCELVNRKLSIHSDTERVGKLNNQRKIVLASPLYNIYNYV